MPDAERHHAAQRCTTVVSGVLSKGISYSTQIPPYIPGYMIDTLYILYACRKLGGA